MTQYRAQILGLRRQLDPATLALNASLDKEHLKNVEAENVRHISVCSSVHNLSVICGRTITAHRPERGPEIPEILKSVLKRPEIH